jgi:quinol monooxygenase YgiN
LARIIVAGTIDFSEGDVSEIIRGGKDYIEASRREKGCTAYDWAADPLVPGRLHVFESWDQETDLGAHFRDSSYTAMRDHLQSHAIKGTDVKLYSVAGIEHVYNPDGTPRAEIFGVDITG